MKDVEFNISANAILAVAPWQAKKDVRFYLKGVCVQADARGRAIAIATDGGALAVCGDTAEYVNGEGKALHSYARGEPIVPLEAATLKALKTPKKEKGTRRLVYSSGMGLRVMTQEGQPVHQQVYINLIDHNYPQWRKMLPTELPPRGTVAAIDPKYAARLEKSAQLASGGIATCVPYQQRDSDDWRSAVTVYLIRGLPEFISVIAPVREKHLCGEAHYPAWFTDEAATSAGLAA